MTPPVIADNCCYLSNYDVQDMSTTPKLRLIVKKWDQINPNPTTERKRKIADANKLELQTVSNWFVNKRDKVKNPEKWEEMKEKKRIWGREQRMKIKAQLNRRPPKQGLKSSTVQQQNSAKSGDNRLS
ncbi:hypothetical protein GCK72_022538 [Caenorhabditis remanei]|uniref:Homeobox domain-containing protein n=1 Tax=Caenorhabditis remanei TaxID=31234 RepID=A0A6A5FUA8_CAERE|nr:hypothetical protein GCK72_022538 [Caenorhabditis remanei]KAF1746086.1 hypothetical protein GCK72_022538 [Caenorhabditis remanei]